MKLVVFEVASVEEAIEAVAISQILCQQEEGCFYLMIGQEKDSIDYVKLMEIRKVCANFPLIARVRRGHVMEAKLCKELGISIIDEHDESIVDEQSFSKTTESFSNMTFIAPSSTFPTALQNIADGAKIIRTHSGEMNSIITQARNISNGALNIVHLDDEQLDEFARREQVPKQLLEKIKVEGFTIPLLACGCINSPADVSLLCQIPNVKGIVIRNELFKIKNSYRIVLSLAESVLHSNNPSKLLEISLNYSLQHLDDKKGNQTTPSHQPIMIENDSKMIEDSSSLLPNNDFM